MAWELHSVTSIDTNLGDERATKQQYSHALCTSAWVYVAIDNSAFKVNRVTQQVTEISQFSYSIDAIAVNSEEAWVIIGTRDGVLHFLSVDTDRVMFSQAIVLPHSVDVPLLQVKCSAQNEEGKCNLVALTNNNQAIIFPDINLASLDSSMQEEEFAQMLKLVVTVKLDLKSFHGTELPCSVSFHDDNVITTGKMCGIQLWGRDNDDYVISDLPLWILSDIGVRKCEISPDNRFILVITEHHDLVVLQLLAGMAVMTNVWKETNVQDFVFCCSSFNQLDQKACILTAGLNRKPAVLSVVTLPGLMVVHSIDVSSSATLCSGVMSEDCILFTNLNINNGQTSVQVDKLVLSEGEDKLRRLIQQKKFVEAESYALNNELDVEMVYRAQAEFLMDAICNDVSGEADELLECLKKIKDVEFVCELCMLSPMSSYNVTFTVLEYCCQVSCSHTAYGELHKKISVMLHKLTMFRLVYGTQAFSVELWQLFLTTTAVDKLKSSLQQGDFSKAAYIWTASLGELIECVDTEVMVDILKAVPEASSSDQLTSWICDIVLPFILEQLPLMLKDFLSWAESIVCKLEEHEKDKWPDNSFTMVMAIQKLLLHKKTDMLVGGDALYKLWDDLVHQLEDLCYLQQKLQFSISLAQHSKVTSEKIVYQLLDRVTVPELVLNVIESQIRPYCARHKLNVDVTLLNYIKRPENQVKSSSEFALERKIVAIVKAIASQQYRVDVCIELVTQYSTGRWSDEMEQLVKACLALSCTGVEELSSRYKLMHLKRVLLEYGITGFSVYPSVKLIRYILKQRGSLQDALEVAEYYELPQTDVYFYHIQNLFLAGECSSGWEMLHSLDVEIGCTVATDVFTNSLEYFTLFSGTIPKNEHIRAVTTCVVCLQYLKGKAGTEQLDTLLVYADQWDCDVDGLLHRLHCLHTLAEKYSIQLSLRQLSDKCYCAELLAKLTEQHLVSAPSSNQDKEETSTSNLVSITVLLGLCEAEFYKRLLRNICKEAISVNQQKLTYILAALDDTPNKETVTVLQQCMMDVWRVASSTTTINLDQQQKLLEALDSLTTKAITVSPADQLMECMEMWRVLRLCIITGRQCKDDVSFSTIEFQPQEEHTCYDLWCWPRRYIETGMILDYGLIMPLIMNNALSLLNAQPGNPSSMLSLCKSLANNGFHQLALDWALIAYHHSLRQEVTVTTAGLQGSPQRLKEYSHAIKGLLKEILSKVLLAKRLEHFYGLSLLLTNHPQISRKQLSLEGMHHRMDTGHLTTIQGVCRLSVYYGCISGDDEVTKMARDYYQHASWGRKLEQYKVPIATGNKSTVVKVLGAMMKEPAIPVNMIVQYSTDYHLNCEEVLARYLATVLEEWPRGYQSVVHEVIGLLKTTEWIEKFFCETLEKVNPYDYERIGFLLEQLKLLGTKEWAPTENLVLLNQLKQYSRVSAPPQCELQFYQHHLACFADTSNSLIVNEQKLPAESKQRLPFHALLEETTAESIITAELCHKTITTLLPIAEELKISTETCYSLAIKNELAAHPEDVSVDNIIELISGIDDYSVAVSAARWTVKQLKLPQDADKRAKLLQKAKALAKQWESSLSSSKEKEKVTMMLKQLTVAHDSTMVEQLLVEYNIAQPRYMKHVEVIGVLISELYNDVPELGDTPVHEIVDRLLSLKPRLNFQKISHRLLDKWLHSGGASPDTALDEDITQHNISLVNINSHETGSEVDEINFKRLCYLLGNRDHLEQNIKHLFSLLKADSLVVSVRMKVTIYKILFAITPVKLLENLSNTSIKALNSQYQVLLFLCDLELLHIKLTPDDFQTINKIGVIHQLLKNHSHDPKAIWLVAEMCQYYEITDVQPWAALLKQLHTLGMVVHIRKLLLGLPSKLSFSLVPVLTSLWETIIMYPFKQGVSPDDQPAECETSIKLLHKIDIPSSKITEHFVASLWAVGLRIEALFCCNMLNMLKQRTISDLLVNLSATDCVTLLDNADTSCLLYSRPVTELLYNYIDDEFKYELIYGTPHFQRLVTYLLKKDQLEHMVVASLKAKRLPEAIRLIEMYYQDKDKFTGAEALKEYVSSHNLQMAITEL